jgi:hypothetical protein|tara:strand:+ start:13551 stop:13970 length:420 start_codon:yes stop_codon:yes gene_type:complete
MKLNFDKAQCFTVPEKLDLLINAELATLTTPALDTSTITFNFRDNDYSAESGGFQPVEIRLELHNNLWQFIYITDFSYQGFPYPELVKEIDICFQSKRVYSLYGGNLSRRDGNELLKLFLSNFIEYHAMGTYQVTVSCD